MTADAVQSVSKTFRFSYPTCTNEEVLFKLEVPVNIPHDGSTRELVQRLINMFHIPVYFEDELNEKLAAFVVEETKSFHDERDARLLDQLKSSELNVDGIVKQWEKLFKENVIEFAEQKGMSDEEVFAEAYHKLVHSPALDTILQVESAYAKTVRDALRSRDEDIKKLTERQTEEMEEKMRTLNTFTTEEDINELAAKHFEEQGVAAGRWGSQTDAVRRAQRTRHRAWLMATAADMHANKDVATPTSPLVSFPVPCEAAPRLEESFTIHLGSQLKQTHNVRIVAADLRGLCIVHHEDSPSRLQTSLSLYSHELCGAVLLTSGTPPPTLAPDTEYHFLDQDAQLANILDKCAEPIEKRNQQRQKDAEVSAARFRPRRGLGVGDVFVTRHSNLAEVHVVFHLVVDDAEKGEITSRHPAILGLRNILKAACTNDVTTISLPLLLRHEFSEEMTVGWCCRRAELVLKCVKGFMVELAGWGGARARTLQVCVPSATPAHVFAPLAHLLPAVFRVNNPVKYRSTDDAA